MNKSIQSDRGNRALLICVLLCAHCASDDSQNDTPVALDNNSGGQMSVDGGGDATISSPETSGAAGTVPIEPTTDSGFTNPSDADAAGSIKDARVTPDDIGPSVDTGAKDTATGDEQPLGDATVTIPPVTDPQKPGPFTPTSETQGPPGYILFYPKELGKDGFKHPIVSWGPGAVENAGIFTTMLNHLASHGFVVISYDATPAGQELVTAIDWMIAENDRTGSVFYQMLDTTKIAAGGHSAGSLATFVIGADPRLTTTMHISGGTFEPHTDINNLHAPALMICGEPGGDGLLMGISQIPTAKSILTTPRSRSSTVSPKAQLI